MKFRIYIYILMAVIIAIAGFDTIESQAAKKRTKAGTTQTSSRKSKKNAKPKGKSANQERKDTPEELQSPRRQSLNNPPTTL